MRFHSTLIAIVVSICCQCAFNRGASACTGIRVKPNDGSVIYARTLEFAMDLRSNVIIIPRGQQFVGRAPGGKPGLSWQTSYGVVGMNGFDLPLIADGVNEKGLAAGIFYFPGYAQYQAVEPDEHSQTLAPEELPAFLLSTCASVKEAVAAARRIKVGEVVFQAMGMVPPIHYVLHDSMGDCVVLEYVEGQLKVHDNPLGVMSNAPTFDWHMTNLGNYVNLMLTNVPRLEVGGVTVKSFGQGTGMLGLPGDFTPPSRFVRAVAFSQSALPVETARDGVLEAFHLLNQFDIPKGVAREVEHGKTVADYTMWTSAADLTNLRYYFHTYDNRRIRMVDLKSVDLDAGEIKTISTKGGEVIEDVSTQGS